jgi:two-component system chemotaxis response regulator CheB
MMMPVLSGLAATEYIMAYSPTPILIVSASINRGELFKTYDALKAGAVDVMEKPNGVEPDERWERRLIATIKLVSRVRVITHPRAKLNPTRRSIPIETPRATHRKIRLVALGASTGGPGTLVEILKALPPTFPLPMLLVIHIGKLFETAFAEWLASYSRIPVRYAEDGEPIPRTGLIMAPPDRHLIVREGRLRLTSDPERHSCRPSVDVLFESIAAEAGRDCLACLLTGMGRDGAQGLLSIRRAGGFTVAQDEATSTVFGMPREAIDLGAAEEVLSLPQIASMLSELSSP